MVEKNIKKGPVTGLVFGTIIRNGVENVGSSPTWVSYFMKININDIKFVPKNFEFALCVYGTPSEEIMQWCQYHNLQTQDSEEFTNILLPKGFDVSKAFFDFTPYEYVDGFSPNLNKHLHVGHLSNFVYAKAFQKMKVGNKFVAVFGDTLNGEVKKEHALDKYQEYCNLFDYKVDKDFYASSVKLKDFSFMTQGDGDYANTKIFQIDDQKIVAIKSDGSTSYFYQDVAVAQTLNASTLYLTGFEQTEHFNNLQKLFPHIQHIGLGLVMLNGKKMSSSEGNVLYISDFLNSLLPLFNNNHQLVWNILASMILKTEPTSVKKIDTSVISNAKISPGLYISYTMAKMHSAGIKLVANETYSNIELAIKALKSSFNLKPNFLMDAILNHCKTINQLYETHYIKDNKDNYDLFQNLTGDLLKATSALGLYAISKV